MNKHVLDLKQTDSLYSDSVPDYKRVLMALIMQIKPEILGVAMANPSRMDSFLDEAKIHFVIQGDRFDLKEGELELHIPEIKL